MSETRTAQIERVPTKPPCYRLIIWMHRDAVSFIEDVFEVELKRYNVLRNIATKRGFIFPTHWLVDKTLQRALGPADHDQGYAKGVIVHEWISLDDEREQRYKLTIHPGQTARNCRFVLYETDTGEERVL